MKYFTKDWYQNCGKLVIPEPLEVDKKAEIYSEEFFQTLYKRKFQDEFRLNKIDESLFQNLYEFTVRNLDEFLPASTRQEVADIRVLALSVTTKKMKRKLEKLVKMQRAEIERPFNEYSQLYRRISRKLKCLTNIDLDYFSFHDSSIFSLHFFNNDFIIELESDYKPVEKLQLVMKNARIIKNEVKNNAARWIYDEMYLVDDRIELHVLVDAEIFDNNEVLFEIRELILQASYIQLNHKKLLE